MSNLVREGTDFNSTMKNVNKEHEANYFCHEGVDEDKNWNNFTFQLPFTLMETGGVNVRIVPGLCLLHRAVSTLSPRTM